MNKSGQTAVETVIFLPFFLGLALALVQVSLIAVGFIYATYGASSIGRIAVKKNSTNVSSYETQFKGLLIAGMSSAGITAEPEDLPPLQTLNISACVSVFALPLVSQVIKMGFPADPGSCPLASADGVIFYSGGTDPHFVIKGTTAVRMNYK
jgi:hypothetical protein